MCSYLLVLLPVSYSIRTLYILYLLFFIARLLFFLCLFSCPILLYYLILCLFYSYCMHVLLTFLPCSLHISDSKYAWVILYLLFIFFIIKSSFINILFSTRPNSLILYYSLIHFLGKLNPTNITGYTHLGSLPFLMIPHGSLTIILLLNHSQIPYS